MSRQPDATPENPDEDGPETDDGEEPDLDGEESFPASDPPAHWMGEDKGA